MKKKKFSLEGGGGGFYIPPAVGVHWCTCRPAGMLWVAQARTHEGNSQLQVPRGDYAQLGYVGGVGDCFPPARFSADAKTGGRRTFWKTELRKGSHRGHGGHSVMARWLDSSWNGLAHSETAITGWLVGAIGQEVGLEDLRCGGLVTSSATPCAC